jgi:SAM-dependent methyltransferase
MLAMVLDACAGGPEPDVTVIDRCPTPLELCRWYAEREQVRIVTAVADATEFEDPDRFDVICTDSLLTLLPAEVRARALRRWRALLRPDGVIVTTARISAREYATDVSREARIAAFAELVRERAMELQDSLDIDPDELAAEALEYGTSVPVYPIASRDELEHAFADAELTLDVLEVLDLPGRVPAEQAGPGAHLSATYARVVARAA